MEKDLKTLFGETMRNAREKQHLTLDELAERVGVSAAYCHDIECGKYTATWVVWLKICAVLNIDIGLIYNTYTLPDMCENDESIGTDRSHL